MNLQRLLILGLAALAAGAAALLVRGLMGGGTPKVEAALPPPVAMSQVLVAATDLQPGDHLSGAQVHFESWPKKAVDASFLTQENTPNPETALNGTVVRTPIIAGEPITNGNVVHSDAAGVMAANLTPGMRAVAITVSTDTGAGGFILPNDRVDLLATVQISETPKRYRSAIILQNLRVLAMDQTFKQDKDQKVVIAKTATLEVTPEQAQLVSLAAADGSLSLLLRSLADSSASALAASALGPTAASSGTVSVIRYGMGHGGGGSAGGESKGQ
jgi:pilus assembly protein CpaB